MVYFATATLRFDGSCNPNPGKGGSGYVLEDPYGINILEGRYYVGPDATNNVAEYFGLIKGLRHLANTNYRIGRLSIEGDSELVINHIKGSYKVKSRRLKPLHRNALKAIERGKGRDFDSYSIQWIDRRYNEDADRLANEARYEETDWCWSKE